DKALDSAELPRTLAGRSERLNRHSARVEYHRQPGRFDPRRADRELAGGVPWANNRIPRQCAKPLLASNGGVTRERYRGCFRAVTSASHCNWHNGRNPEPSHFASWLWQPNAVASAAGRLIKCLPYFE